MTNDQTTMIRQEPITNNQLPKSFNLEERTLHFSKSVLIFSRSIPRSLESEEMLKQVIRSAMSVGANYREANEAVSKKDFTHRLKISRKEAKETYYWLELIIFNNSDFAVEGENIISEAKQLIKIFSSIIAKMEANRSH